MVVTPFASRSLATSKNWVAKALCFACDQCDEARFGIVMRTTGCVKVVEMFSDRT